MLKGRYQIIMSVGLLISLIFHCCDSNNEPDPVVEILSGTINGHPISGTIDLIPVSLEIEIVFSTSVESAALEEAISLTNGNNSIEFVLALTNSNTKAIITSTLQYENEYTFTIEDQIIGAAGEKLDHSVEIPFTTITDETINSISPCFGTTSCKEPLQLAIGENEIQFPTYSNYPYGLDNTIWPNLETAIIVVHGQNRDADNYFQYLSSVLFELELSETTLLVAPLFAESEESLVWKSNSWRQGGQSEGVNKVSSYSVIDTLIYRLSRLEKFPNLKRLILTGHSSGGTFTHTYSAATTIDMNISQPVTYIVANSQYFYYPLEFRFDEATNGFFTPTNCTGYNSWPFGFENLPTYVNAEDGQSVFNQLFSDKQVKYLLGNDTSGDGALNTTDCRATLLGSTRYDRGENIFGFMNKYFPEHNHGRTIVQSVGHNGEQMYKSEAFKSLLQEILNE